MTSIVTGGRYKTHIDGHEVKIEDTRDGDINYISIGELEHAKDYINLLGNGKCVECSEIIENCGGYDIVSMVSDTLVKKREDKINTWYISDTMESQEYDIHCITEKIKLNAQNFVNIKLCCSFEMFDAINTNNTDLDIISSNIDEYNISSANSNEEIMESTFECVNIKTTENLKLAMHSTEIYDKTCINSHDSDISLKLSIFQGNIQVTSDKVHFEAEVCGFKEDILLDSKEIHLELHNNNTQDVYFILGKKHIIEKGYINITNDERGDITELRLKDIKNTKITFEGYFELNMKVQGIDSLNSAWDLKFNADKEKTIIRVSLILEDVCLEECTRLEEFMKVFHGYANVYFLVVGSVDIVDYMKANIKKNMQPHIVERVVFGS